MKTAEKQNRMDELAIVLNASTGNESSGKPFFQAICGTCHELFGEGGTIGPDLTGYERSNQSYLLAHTIDPHAEIREGYVNYRIDTKDGRVLNGVIIERFGGRIRLRTITGQELELDEEQIRQMKAQAQSMMPEHLLDALTDEQIRDLFAYLMKTD